MTWDLKQFWVGWLLVSGDRQRAEDWLRTIWRRTKDYALSHCVSDLAFTWMRRIPMIKLASDPPFRGVLYLEETKSRGYRKINYLRFLFLRRNRQFSDFWKWCLKTSFKRLVYGLLGIFFFLYYNVAFILKLVFKNVRK